MIEIYNSYHPTLISKSALYTNDLEQSIKTARYIFLGEVHGATQNCDVVYSLITHYGIKNIAIELPSNLKDFINSCIQNKPDFTSINNLIFTASVLSVEMAKTIALLANEGRINTIHYTDSDSEEGMAKNILSINEPGPILIQTGNWHSATHVMDGGKHTSSYFLVKESGASVVNIEIKYLSGAIYNDGRIVEFESSSPSKQYALKKLNNTDYELTLPVATPIFHNF